MAKSAEFPNYLFCQFENIYTLSTLLAYASFECKSFRDRISLFGERMSGKHNVKNRVKDKRTLL